MKIKQIVEIEYRGSYCSYAGLDIDTSDGSEVKISLSDDQWIELGKRVSNKCDQITEKRKKNIQLEIDNAVETALSMTVDVD